MALSSYKQYKKITEELKAAILNDKVSHAYIIEGNRLSRKKDFALDFAKAMTCATNHGDGCDMCSICSRIDKDSYEDMYVVPFDGKTVKDQAIEKLQRDLMNVPSAEAKINIAIVEDSDRMTVRAQNRLLKTLEEPLSNAVILLLSENSQALLQTVRSRCVKIKLGEVNATDAEELEFAQEMEFAQKVLQTVLQGHNFYEWKKMIEEKIKTPGDARRFLEAMEKLLCGYLKEEVNGKSPKISREKIFEAVHFIEETVRDMEYNISYMYAIKRLLLSIGG